MAREYGSLTTYLDEAGTLVVRNVDGSFRDHPADIPSELSRLRGEGWELVEIETGETPVPVGETERQLLATTYLLRRG